MEDSSGYSRPQPSYPTSQGKLTYREVKADAVVTIEGTDRPVGPVSIPLKVPDLTVYPVTTECAPVIVAKR